MKPEADKYQAINVAARKEKLTQLLVFVVVVLIASLTYFTLPKETKILTATTESVGVAQTNVGTRVFWVVKLDNGGFVRVLVSNDKIFNKGQRISVVEISSEIGTKKYRLSKILGKKNNQAQKKDADNNSAF